MKTIKTLTIILAAALSLAACSSQRSAAEKSNDARQLAMQIDDSVAARTLHISFDFVYPQRFPSRSLTSEYDIEVRNDSVFSYLPYFGRAYRTDITRNDRSPLDFKSSITHWLAEAKNKRTEIRFAARNNFEVLLYAITIFPNGKASLHVKSSDREPITFDGEMDVELENR